MIDKVFYYASLDKVLRYDSVNILGLDTRIESALRIYDYYRASFAKTEAAGANYLDLLIQTVLCDELLKTLDDLKRI